MLRWLPEFLAVVLISGSVYAHTHWAQYTPFEKKWIEQQVIPNTDQQCCDLSDGEFAEEKLEDNKHWVKFSMTNGEWMEVPEEVIIYNNPLGRPVVWWQIRDYNTGEFTIRCFAPGVGL